MNLVRIECFVRFAAIETAMVVDSMTRQTEKFGSRDEQQSWHQTMKIKDRFDQIAYETSHETMAETVTAALAEGVSLAWLDLFGYDLSSCNLCWADMSFCDLRECTLPKDLRSCNLSEAVLEHDLTECDLRGANLRYCDLRDCKLPKDLSGCDLSEAILPGE